MKSITSPSRTRAKALIRLMGSNIVGVLQAAFIAATFASIAQAASTTAPEISISPGAHDFGSKVVGSGTDMDFTVTNTGIVGTIHGVVVIGDWSVVSSGCASTLAAGASCTVKVRFSPSTLGSRAGELRVSSSAPQSPAKTILTGNGLPAAQGEAINRVAVIRGFYETILGRQPDVAGVDFWNAEATRLTSLGADVREVFFALSIQFFNSPEYVGRNTTETQYLVDLYRTFFLRDPDPSGLAYWQSQLTGGMDRGALLTNFLFSAEFGNKLTALFGSASIRPEINMMVDLYRGILGVLPDSGGFNYWLGQLRAAQCEGGSRVAAQVASIAESFITSAEYAQKEQARPANERSKRHVGDLYNAFLRRGADLGGYLYWAGQLDTSALTRAQVRAAYINSPEFQARVAQVIAIGCYTACPAGSFSSATGCTSCPVGHFSAVAGSMACTPCPVGQFSAVTGAVACSQCPSGQTSPVGASACTLSPPAAPTAVSATARDSGLLVSFTPPIGLVTSYTATCRANAADPGIAASGSSSPISVPFMSSGTLTCTVTASNAAGVGPPSAPSAAVTRCQPSLAFQSVQSSAIAGAAFNPQPVVGVKGVDCAVATNSTASISLSSQPAGLTCTGGTSVAAVAGQATFSGCRIGSVGNYVLTATADGRLPATTAVTSTTEAEAEADIVRFLAQATMGATEPLIEEVKRVGIDAWLDQQLGMYESKFTPLPVYYGESMAERQRCLDDRICVWRNFGPNLTSAEFFRQAITGRDQVRQRFAYVLHQLFVLGQGSVSVAYAINDFQQRIRDFAFSTYEDALYQYSVSPQLGEFQGWVNNVPEKNGVKPNENYAREILQLLTTGVNRLNEDGTERKDGAGNLIPAYTQDDVTTLSRVFTGFTNPRPAGLTPFFPNGAGYYIGPMVPFDQFHDKGLKTLFDGAVQLPAGQGADAEVRAAIRALVADSNTPPFICKQLIQRLVTSSPSPGYVRRVVEVFKNNGSEVRGDLKAVLRAILMDPEARGARKTEPSYGRMREPALFFTSILRALDIQTDGVAPSSFGYGSQMNLFLAPTVFSYFPADFRIANGTLPGAEFGIYGTSAYVSRTNIVNWLGVCCGFPPEAFLVNATGTQMPTLSAFLAVTANPAAFVARLNRLFFHGTLSSASQTTIINAVTAIPASDALTRARVGVYLALTSLDYLIQQ